MPLNVFNNWGEASVGEVADEFFYNKTVLVFLNVYGAPESIPRNEFRRPM
jgi:hypothetical protein